MYNVLGVALLYTQRLRGRRREFIILERPRALAGQRERPSDRGHTCFLLTFASLQYLLNQPVMNRPDQRVS